MIELPQPDFTGADDSERLQKVIRYLEGLHHALEQKFSNIDASDLNAATAAQLDGGAAAPDLGAYATRAAMAKLMSMIERDYTQKADLKDYATDEEKLDDWLYDHTYAQKSWVSSNFQRK